MTDKRSFISSIILHAIILALFIPYSFHHLSELKPGDSDHQAIDAYVFPDIVSHHETAINSKSGIALSKQKIEKRTTAQTHEQSRASSKGEQTQGLFALLHNAIQKQQQYPESAQEMGREGRSTVSFMLFPDGHVSKVIIIHSSGMQLLDSAAIAAVTRAAPFVGIEQYVHEAGAYNIDVTFTLS